MSLTPMPQRLFDETMPVGVYAPRPEVVNPSGNVLILPRQEAVQTARTPRWYQSDSLVEAWDRFNRGSNAELLVLPTGCGKTFTAALFILECIKRKEPVLILCNRDKLIRQMQEDLNNEGIFPLIEQASRHALSHFHAHGIVVLGSVQTMRGDRLQQWPKDAFRWVISDEAHNVPADTWALTIEHFQSGGAKHLGLTATPYNPKKSLKDYFAFPWIRKITLREAIEQKYLVRLHLKIAPIDPIDLRQVGMVGKDFDHQALDRKIWENTSIIASALKKLGVREDGSRRAGINFTPHVVSAEGLAAAMRDFGVPSASISWKSPDPDYLYNRFKPREGMNLGEIENLFNVSVLAEGFNAPWADLAGLCRPSLNIGLVTQWIGRITRQSPLTGKVDGLIVEMPCIDDKQGKNSLKSSLDAILDGAEADDDKPTKEEQEYRFKVRDRTDEIIKSGKETDLLSAHSMAKQQINDEQKRAMQRIEIQRQDARRAKFQEQILARTAVAYDPFAGINKKLGDQETQIKPKSATPEQIRRINELSGNFPIRGLVSFEAAERRIEDLEIRKRFNLASDSQLRMMTEWLGCAPKKASRMKKWEASKWIDQTKVELQAELVEQHGWGWDAAKEVKPWELLKTLNELNATKAFYGAELTPENGADAPQMALADIS